MKVLVVTLLLAAGMLNAKANGRMFSSAMKRGEMRGRNRLLLGAEGTTAGKTMDDDALAGIFLSHGMAMASQCDIDLMGLVSVASSLPTMDANGLGGGDANSLRGVAPGSSEIEALGQELFKTLAKLFDSTTCSASEEAKFRSSLKEFESCSSFDLEKVMETFFDAEVGALMECALAAAPMIESFNKPDFEFVVPDQCIESLLGKNPLGDMSRTTRLFPDKVLPCFSALSTQIPSCTVHEWPVPLVGPFTKKITCLIGAAMPLLEAIQKVDLLTLATCLPKESPLALSQQECADSLKQCVDAGSSSMSQQEPFLGAPLSDTAKRVAKQEGLDDVPARYQSFVDSCVNHVWQGWSYKNHDYQVSDTSPSVNTAVAPGSEDNDTTKNQPCHASSTSLLSKPKQTKQAPAFAERSGPPGGRFGGGILTGVILTGVLWGLVAHRKKHTTKGGHAPYETVEMTDSA